DEEEERAAVGDRQEDRAGAERPLEPHLEGAAAARRPVERLLRGGAHRTSFRPMERVTSTIVTETVRRTRAIEKRTSFCTVPGRASCMSMTICAEIVVVGENRSLGSLRAPPMTIWTAIVSPAAR